MTNYYPKIGVALIRLNHKGVRIGEHLIIEGHTTYNEQDLESMQIEHKNVAKAKKGEDIAIKVSSRVRENDQVFTIK